MTLLASVTEQQYSTPELAGLPEGWWRLLGLLLLAGMGYVIFWLYRREARAGASAGLRVGLGCVRSVVILLLTIVWLEPVIATYTIRTITASVAVLIDVSASMGIVDSDTSTAAAEPDPAAPRSTRIARVADLLSADDHDWLRRLAARNDLLTYTFGERTSRHPLPWDKAPPVRTAPATQSAGLTEAVAAEDTKLFTAVQSHTDLGQALTTVRADVGESPVAGVVLISDGIFNQGMSADDAAAYARRFKVPLYTVGVGSPREPPNLRITNFAAPATAAKGDPFEVRVEATAAGVELTPVRLALTARQLGAETSGERVIATREISIGGDQPHAEARFRIDADAAGELVYRAQLAAVPDEAVESDNRRESTVLVLDERLRVLLIAGHPSYEYRYVTRLLEREKTIDLSCWLQSADDRAVSEGNTVITELPRRPEEIFEYDVLLLLDPNPRELDSAWAITVRRLVDEFGGGVFLQAGPHFASRFLRDPRLEELVTILPVLPDPDADVRLSEQGAFRTRPYPIGIPDASRAHPLLRLHAEADTNRAIWRALPGAWWYLPVLREKPLAAALMRHGSSAHATRYGQPVLMATQPFGAGRTVFLAFENTWRWRSTGERYFNRFWIQAVRYLAQPRREGVSKRGTIVLDREAIRPGDYVKIEARVLDARFVPWHQPEVVGSVELPHGEERPLTLKAIPGRAGWFAGRVAIDWTGPAIIRMPLPRAEAEEARGFTEQALVKYIQVESSDVELRSLAARAEPLMKLAEQTGAQYFPLDEAGGLPDLIENASQVAPPTRGVDKSLWDKTWLLVLIATLLGVEWTLRRRNHLL
ncbi:MAG: hypothetical protein ACE5I3_12780 [Phycisphaerae bacterium]